MNTFHKIYWPKKFYIKQALYLNRARSFRKLNLLFLMFEINENWTSICGI